MSGKEEPPERADAEAVLKAELGKNYDREILAGQSLR